ncbi:sarcosine oxidase subunit delta [SAR202 cluster bacterium AD-804-J14_MRT_500m]|nr:sarcosine oxidase subunit delta [SAR202 cluster bacterium AD-804-J14_MRT_500m]
MAFLIACPNCGERSAYDFTFGGEAQTRPAPDDSAADWTKFLYYRSNLPGTQREWWYHRFGCRRWLMVERDSVTNRVDRTFWPNSSNNG